MKNKSPQVLAARRSTVTNADLISLLREAANAADLAQVKICNRALLGSKRARKLCERIIRAGRIEVAACPD